jgi:hypothetical protein
MLLLYSGIGKSATSEATLTTLLFDFGYSIRVHSADLDARRDKTG